MDRPLNAVVGSMNDRAAQRVDGLVADADMLRLRVQRMACGAQLIDAGIECAGGIEAGRRIAEICLGGIGRVSVSGPRGAADWPRVEVSSADPVRACLGSQYAGWSLSHGEGKQAFRALGSGPARLLGSREPLIEELAIAEQSDSAVMVIEVDRMPPQPLVLEIATACGVPPESLRLILTPTCSLAGSVQICARVVEVALHKAHELGFELANIVDACGSAPLPPPSPDMVRAMGRTNDAILFDGAVQLFVAGDDAAAERLCRSLPSSQSRDYGQPFADVFKAAGYDFFKIDPMLFSPAQVLVSALESGKTYRAGRADPALLARSFEVSA